MALTIPDYRLPPDLEAGAQGGPEWDDDIQEAVTGQEVVNQRWSTARHRYTFGYVLERMSNPAAGYNAVRHIWLVHGKRRPFRFERPGGESNAVDENFGTGDGATTAFQLSRYYDPQQILLGTAGTYFYRHPIYLLRVGTTPIIKVAGTPTTAFTLSETCLVSFTSAPANGAALTWSGVENLAMRFDVDRFSAVYNADNMAKIGQITIRELVGTRELLI